MKPIISALIAVLCYAIGNVLLEMKLSKYNPLTIVSCYATVIAIVALTLRQVTKTADPSFNFPTGTELGIAIALGLILTVADYCYVNAYSLGGSLLTVSTIVAMFPIFASIVKFIAKGTYPNGWQVAGYVLALLAVVLVAKGSENAK